MPDTQLTPEQIQFVETTRKAAARACLYAQQADELNMPILAREWDYVAKCLTDKVGLQIRAFRDDTLAGGK